MWRLVISLLNDVRQFVREQLPSVRALRRVLRRPEHDIAPRRVSQRVHRPRRLCRTRVRVHAHVAEVLAETVLHLGARGRVERSARAEAAREAVGDGDGGGVRRRPDSALNPDSFFLTLGARCSAVRTRRAGPLNRVRGRARHTLGYAVCFSLVRIVGRTLSLGWTKTCRVASDCQTGLYVGAPRSPVAKSPRADFPSGSFLV